LLVRFERRHEQLARVIEKIAKEQPNTVMIRCPTSMQRPMRAAWR
jgi:hypothetical protein